MILQRPVWLLMSLVYSVYGCATYPDVKELKVIGYSDDVSKGKSVGPIEAADCLWYILGYPLGSAPDIAKALANARTQKNSSTVEELVNTIPEGKTLRYVNNVSAKYDSFDAYLIGRSCIKVKGLGYL